MFCLWRYFPLKALLLLLMLGATQGAAQDNLREPAGSRALPVYRMDYGDPHYWVQKNAVKLISNAQDFDIISKKILGKLSTACALGTFNQRRNNRFFVVAKTSRAGQHLQSKRVVVLGYAHGRGVNLRDPNGLANAAQSYLFRYDRTGKCQVFAGN